MTGETSMSAVLDVKSAYRRLDIVEHYASTSELTTAERVLFERLHPEIAGKKVLDIGIGTGRTTPHLAALSGRYIGLDYSPEMVQRAREIHPGLEILECDARDLSRFGPAVFDFVLFSFNGIDSVSDADRYVVLRQVYTALRPGGIFMFSAHNLASKRTSAFSFKNIHWKSRPIELLSACAYYVKGVLNHLHARSTQVRTADYALLTERATNYQYLNYYVSKALQVEQLERTGFKNMEIFTEDGRPTLVQNVDRDRWLYYVARKPA
jgi:ubiquinone/menaquinone biosynthesis C-methylase UbiE